MIRHKQTFDSRFSPKQLFDLVADIENYPRFLPWCSDAKIISREENSCIAELVIYFAPISYKYVSKVSYDNENYKIDVDLVEGPFEYLSNKWRFETCNNGTIIEFELEFECKSKMLEKMIGLMFEKALTKLVKAFQKRAEALYG